jgi:N-acetylglucosaminyldiphosphoundecaprenol N-acetyl-beta-D-mannosaminyltransferase
MPTKRENFLDVAFDVLPVDRLLSRIGAVTSGSAFQYLVTPNVDHMVRLHKSRGELAGLADAYLTADLCVCDSKVLARLARWRGVELPVVPGSDLTAALFERIIEDGDHIAIVGGNAAMIDDLKREHPAVHFAQHCPPMGLMRNAAARTEAAQFIVEQKARFTFLCVGSPQQELIAAEASRIGGGRGMAFCIGAAIEFITGHTKRAPRLARRLGLEWAHRLVTNPRRLWRRYLIEGPAIFVLAYRWRRSAA